MSDVPRRLLLLGGGHAHLGVLEAFARQPLPAGTEVLLLTPSDTGLYSGMVPGVVAGRFAAAEATMALAPLAARAGVQLLHGRAVALDAAARRVRLADGRELGYDGLSLDVGGTLDRELIDGGREHALAVRPLEAFVPLADELVALAGRRVLDIVVIGGGAAAVEVALGLSARLAGSAPAGGDAGAGLGPQARLVLAVGRTPLLDGYAEGVIARARRWLLARRIAVVPERVVALDGRSARLASGARLACDAAVLATGSRPWPWLASSGLALAADGFVATGASLQSLSHPEVFAAGDCASRDDGPWPRSGVLAVRAGPPLAANLRRFVAGQPPAPWTPPRRTLNLLATGDGGAIASWGGVSAEGRWVGWLKDRIDRAWVARFPSA